MALMVEIKGETVNIGDFIKLTQSFKEGDKERSQAFEGIVISIKGRGENKSLTIRKTAVGGIGVEKIVPVFSPTITKVTVKKKGKVRRAKLYYLRKK